MNNGAHPRNLRLLRDNGTAPNVAEPGPLATDTRPLEHTIRYQRKAAPVADSLTRPPDNPEQPRRPSLRERWEHEVWTTTAITDGCRVLLLAMARHMDRRGYISVPRPRLAAEIGRNERRVGERIEQACRLNLLARVQRGQKGVTSVYRIMLPDPLSRLGDSPLNAQQAANPPAEMGAAKQPADGGFSRPPGGPASSKAHPESNVQLEREPGGSHSPFFSENEELEPNPAETAEAKAALRRAHESWNIPVPAHLLDTA